MISVTRGEWSFHLLRAESGRAFGDEMLEIGERSGDELRLAAGHLYGGLAHMYLANFEVAATHLDQSFAHYHRAHAFTQLGARSSE